MCFKILPSRLCFVNLRLRATVQISHVVLLTLGQSAHYTSTNGTVAVFTVHTVSIGTVYKENYMKNNINMFSL